MSIPTWLSEPRILGALVVLGLVLRVAMAWRFRVDSDEPQHLHVVWAWTRGLLPYRDVFDNHMPLFHLLTAPALLPIGERPTALLWMRLLMLPQWGAALLVTALIGRRLFTSRVGAWSAVLAGFYPLFFFCSLEFRPDVLWTVLWLSAILVAIGGSPTVGRGFLLGLVLGTAAAVSLKTTMMVGAFGIAIGLTMLLAPAGRRPWQRVCSAGLAAAAGLALPPVLVGTMFLSAGALGPFLYGTVWHNLTPGLDTASKLPVQVIAVVLMVLAWRGGRALAQHAESPDIGLRRAFVLLVGTSYVAILIGLWPLVSRQDHLPTVPLVAISITAVCIGLPLRWRAGIILIALGVAIELALVVSNGSVRLGEAEKTVAFESDVLGLVRPGEPVLDLKGDTIFRPRPVYWAFEGVTKARLRGGLLTDDFAGRLVGANVRVVAGNVENLPIQTRRWVRAHYLRVTRYPGVGGILVAGARFDEARGGFEVGIPALYAVVEPSGTLHGLLDGQPYTGPRRLRPGFHSYQPAPGESHVALLWSTADKRAFSPYDAEGNWR